MGVGDFAIGVLGNLVAHPLCKMLDSETLRRLCGFCEDSKRRKLFEAAIGRVVTRRGQELGQYLGYFADVRFQQHQGFLELAKLFRPTDHPDAANLASAIQEVFPDAPANVETQCRIFIDGLVAELRAEDGFQGWIDSYRIDRTAHGVEAIQAQLESLRAEMAASRKPRKPTARKPKGPSRIDPPDPGFVGRADEIAALEAALTAGGVATIAAIRGMGGVGKTQLARLVAQRLADRFPDGRIAIDMAGTGAKPLADHEAAKDVIRAFSPQARLPDAPDQLIGHYKDFLAGKRCLVLLDNARDLAQIRRLLGVQPPAAVLVTSRREIRPGGHEPILLGALSEAEAEELLRHELGDRAVDDARVADLVEASHRLPIALRAAGRTLAQSPSLAVEAFLAALRDKRRRLSHLAPEDDVELNVRAVLLLSLDRLAIDDPALLQAFRTLAIFPASFDLPAAAGVWAVDEATAGAALDKLWRWSLLELATNRFHVHDLYRDLASAGLDDKTRDTAGERHSRHFSGVLRKAKELYKSGGDRVLAGLALFDRERANIEAGHAWALARAERSEAAAQLVADYPDAGVHVLNLRLPVWTRIAWLEAQANICRRLSDRRGEGNALGNIGLAWAHLGEARKAIGFYEQVLAVTREIGDRRGEGNMLGNLGIAWRNLGDARKAIGFYEQQLVIARENSDRRGEGQTLGNLGNAWADLGEVRKAISFYEQWLVIAREIGERKGEGSALGNLGNAWRQLGDAREAIGFLKQAQVISREISDRRGEGNSLGNLGTAWAVLGEARKAIGFFEQQLVIAREIGDRRGEAIGLWNSALAHDTEGERERAIELGNAALAICRQIEHAWTPKVEAQLREWGVDPDAV